MADDLAKAEQEVEALRKSLLEARDKLKDNTLKGFGGDVPPLGNINIKLRRTLKGHLHKIYAMQWAKDKPHLASASQDGKVIVWNAITCLKQHALPLKNTWVMTCSFSPSGDFVASGGLDNICTVHNLKASDPNKPFRELQGHNGFLSGCRFLSEKEIITASGDYTAALWDIEQGEKKLDFIGHQKDVTFVALSNDGSQIATSSVDRSARIWDVKTGKCVRYFQGPPLPPPQPNQEITGDANCVEFFPGGEAISVAYEDGVIRLFDSRSYSELNVYNPPDNHGSAVSLAFTSSGRYMFASYAEQPKCVAWDFIKAETKGALSHHDKRISSIGIGGGGSALCTASWDQTLKIWA